MTAAYPERGDIMRSSILIGLVVLLLAAGTVATASEPPPGQNVVGIYTGDFTGPTWSFYDGEDPEVTVYIVLSGLDCTPVAGWEMQVDVVGAGVAFLTAEIFGDGPMNLFTPPIFQTGFQTPLGPNASGVFPVASLTYQVLSTSPTTLEIQAIALPSMPYDPGPCYAPASDVCELAPLYLPNHARSGPVFGFNAGWQGSEGRTWGAIKGAYR